MFNDSDRLDQIETDQAREKALRTHSNLTAEDLKLFDGPPSEIAAAAAALSARIAAAAATSPQVTPVEPAQKFQQYQPASVEQGRARIRAAEARMSECVESLPIGRDGKPIMPLGR